jgi:hypothetical protein
MKRAIAIGVVLAAVLVPAASARSGVHVKLSVLPLPQSVIGSAAQSLPLQPNSGVDAPGVGTLLSPIPGFVGGLGCNEFCWAKLGGISGYALDYGQGASGGAGVTEVRTSVDKYKTAADAKKGLALWKADESQFVGYPGYGLTIDRKKKKVAAVGEGRFAFLVSYRAPNIAPLFGLDEQFRQGRYEAEVTVWAGSSAAATTLAPTLAKKLDARIKRALAGKLHAKPVKLPPAPQPGPPPGGPDLTPLPLQASDLSGPTKVYGPSWDVDSLHVFMEPAGQFVALYQDVIWCPTANQASFMADSWLAEPFAGPGGTAPLDLSSLGDGAQAIIANKYYPAGWDARVVFSSGRLVETLELGGQNAHQASEVKNIAQTVANKINSAGLGS